MSFILHLCCFHKNSNYCLTWKLTEFVAKDLLISADLRFLEDPQSGSTEQIEALSESSQT